MNVPPSAVRERATKPRVPMIDDVLAARLQRLIAQHPTFGYHRLWALLRFHDGLPVDRKAVYHVLVLKGWFVHQRRTTPRPRVQERRSRATRSNERWAVDLTHIDCRADGWAHFAAVIDCDDRDLVGYEFARRGRAKEANGRSRPRASSASARCGLPASRRCSAVTTEIAEVLDHCPGIVRVPRGSPHHANECSEPRTLQRIVPARPTPPGRIVRAAMRTFLVALVLSTASLAVAPHGRNAARRATASAGRSTGWP
jgi:putative transposase